MSDVEHGFFIRRCAAGRDHGVVCRYVPRWGHVNTPVVDGARFWKTRAGAEGWIRKQGSSGHGYEIVLAKRAPGNVSGELGRRR